MWIATDVCGNSSTQVQIIKVIDTIAPLMTMLPIQNAFANCDEGQVHGCPIPIDNCDATPSLLFEFYYKPYIGGCANSYIVVRKWTGGDKCGNTSVVTQNVNVVDQQAPELTCSANINITSLIPIAVTWPMPKAWDDCDGALIAVQIDGPKNGSLFDPGTITTIVFEATDYCGNISTCSFTVIINKDIIINQGLKISGDIKNMNGGLIENSLVNIKGDLTQFQAVSAGKFEFTGIAKGSTEELNVTKVDHPLEGVNTLDLIYITNHILGKKVLNSPYKMLAADVTNNGSISSADLIEIRKLILHIIDKFKDVDSWKFLPSTFNFQNPLNPWKDLIVSTDKIENIQTDQKRDFNGIKMGDVNWDATGKVNGNIEVKSNNIYSLSAESKEYKDGEELEMVVSSKDIKELKGLQFTLEYNLLNLEYVGIKDYKSEVTEDNFGFRYLDKGIITGSIDFSNSRGNNLFTILFKAKAAGEFKNDIQLSSKVTKAEAYTNDDETFGLNLVFELNGKSLHIETPILYQNEPNPFESSTLIRFDLPETQEAILSIYTLDGKLVKEIDKVYNKGEHSETFENEEFTSSSCFYYKLKTNNFVDIKKMIYIK
jgi:hypothetical protein